MLVYNGPGQRAWETVPDPQIEEPSDVIVHVDTTTICGTDCTSSRATCRRRSPGRSSATRRSAQ